MPQKKQISPQDELNAYYSVQNALARLKTNRVTQTQALAIRELLATLGAANLPAPDSPDISPETPVVVLGDEDLKFVQEMRAKKFHPEIISAMCQAMEAVLANPNHGKAFSDCLYASLFKSKMPDYTGKAFIFKVNVRLRYRLIYACGGSLERPVFLDFNHRKDIYKHAGFGQSSS